MQFPLSQVNKSPKQVRPSDLQYSGGSSDPSPQSSSPSQYHVAGTHRWFGHLHKLHSFILFIFGPFSDDVSSSDCTAQSECLWTSMFGPCNLPLSPIFIYSFDLSKFGQMNWNETICLASQLPPHQSNSVIKQDWLLQCFMKWDPLSITECILYFQKLIRFY